MGSKIEWTDATWNPIRRVGGGHACEKVSPGCKFCYAERMQPRFGNGPGRYDGKGEVYLDERVLTQPLRWKKPRMVFVCSMTDLFWEKVPDSWIASIFAVMADAEQHTFQVLTKRAERLLLLDDDAFLESVVEEASLNLGYDCADFPLPNVWLGVSAENQRYWDERVPWLVKTPAAVRFVSCEPLLGEIDCSPYLDYNPVYENGRESLSGREKWNTGNRCEGAHLEGREKGMGSLEERSGKPEMFQSSGRTSFADGISPDSSNVRRDEIQRLGASSGMAAFQGTDTGWHHNKPRQRDQRRQQAREPGTGDLFGAGDSRESSSWDRDRGESARDEKPPSEIDECPGNSNQDAQIGRGETAFNREGFRNQLSARIENRKGCPAISWLITGGESGPKARPSHPDWFRSLRDQCKAAGVAYFHKQWGEWSEDSNSDVFDFRKLHERVCVVTNGKRNVTMYKVGKKAAGRLLDGREWNELPIAAQVAGRMNHGN